MQHKNEDYALKTTCLCINDQLPVTYRTCFSQRIIFQ